MISISIVSHAQWHHVQKLLSDIAGLGAWVDLEVLLTFNVPEAVRFRIRDYPWPVKLFKNSAPKGFGANHNAAFKQAKGEWFCALNPDIRLMENPFPDLLSDLVHRSASVIAPAVMTPSGCIEDNARYFPRFHGLSAKFLGFGDGRYPYAIGGDTFAVDWVAGMFMLFRSEDFRSIGGFDEKFFLYYEDVDICTRLWKAGRPVMVCPQVQVVHDAQRASRKNWQFMKWHAASMARYFWKHWGRLPRKSVS